MNALEEKRRLGREKARRHREKDPSRYRERSREKYAKNLKRNRELKRLAAERYRKNNLDKCREWSRRYQQKHKRRLREAVIVRKYKLTLAQFNDLLNRQHGRCAICRTRPNKTLNIDHCHETGKVRGLLCGGCNLMLGHSRESIATLTAAIHYLRKLVPELISNGPIK